MLFIPICCIAMRSEWMLIKLGQDERAAQLAQEYMIYFIPGMLGVLISSAQQRLLQAFKKPTFLIYLNIIATGSHYFICSILVNDFSLGVKGAAIATSMTKWVKYLLALYACYYYSDVRVALVKFDWQQMMFKKILNLGFYNMIMNSLKWWAFQYLLLLAGSIGIAEQTSFITIFQLNFLLMAVPIGLSIAFS